MSASANANIESGQIPGRLEWVPEPAPGEVPTDPDFQYFSDVIETFEVEGGASLARQDGIGTSDAVDYFRGTEDPSLDVTYPLYRFPVDGNGDPQGAEAYGMLRDASNDILSTLLVVHRREYANGGNDDAGVREFTVARGVAVESVESTLDPSSELPIALDLSGQPRKVRSYLIHQPSAGTTLDIVSTSANDTMDITIEDEGANTTETITLTGDTSVTTTTSFDDIDAIWLSNNPEGDIEITDGSGTTLMSIEGGLSYSDDDQPVDGDRGVPTLGAGSHGTKIGGSGEHFVGDTFLHDASSLFQRITSAGWTIENDIETTPTHDSRAPAVDVGNRTITVDVDAQGEFVSHSALTEALQRLKGQIVHELGGGTINFNNTVPTDPDAKSVEADQAVSGVSVSFEASGDNPIELVSN